MQDFWEVGSYSGVCSRDIEIIQPINPVLKNAKITDIWPSGKWRSQGEGRQQDVGPRVVLTKLNIHKWYCLETLKSLDQPYNITSRVWSWSSNHCNVWTVKSAGWDPSPHHSSNIRRIKHMESTGDRLLRLTTSLSRVVQKAKTGRYLQPPCSEGPGFQGTRQL